jgi:hypothetical protein
VSGLFFFRFFHSAHSLYPRTCQLSPPRELLVQRFTSLNWVERAVGVGCWDWLKETGKPDRSEETRERSKFISFDGESRPPNPRLIFFFFSVSFILLTRFIPELVDWLKETGKPDRSEETRERSKSLYK